MVGGCFSRFVCKRDCGMFEHNCLIWAVTAIASVYTAIRAAGVYTAIRAAGVYTAIRDC
jgi:hypothetical protein